MSTRMKVIWKTLCIHNLFASLIIVNCVAVSLASQFSSSFLSMEN